MGRRVVVLGLLLWGFILAVWLTRVYFLIDAEQVHRNHEGAGYAIRLVEFRDLLRAGYLSPQWATHFREGLGSPYFSYYQSGFFYAASLVPWSVAPNRALGVTVAVFALLGYAGMLGLVRRWFGLISGGLAGSLLLLSVYASSEIYIRGDLSEFCAMMTLPVALGALAGWMHEGHLRKLTLLALANMGLIVLHPAIALVANGVLALLIVGLLCSAQSRPRGASVFSDHGKLPHHPVIFMLQHMTVVHVGQRRIRVFVKPHEDAQHFFRVRHNGVFQSGFHGMWRFATPLENTELGVMDMKGVRHPRLIGDFPNLRPSHRHDLIHPLHVHLHAVDRVRP